MDKDRRPKSSQDALTINKKFAEQYDARKRRELLNSLPPETLRALDDDSSSQDSSSDSEEEDEFGEQLTKKIDKRIHDTLVALQKKDPKIYNKEATFFKGSRNDSDAAESSGDESESGDEPVAGWDTIAKATENSTPKLTIKDYVRENLLADGRLDDSDADDDLPTKLNDEESFGDRRELGHLKDEKSSVKMKKPAVAENLSKISGADVSNGEVVGEDSSNSSEDCGEEGEEEEEEFFTKKPKTAEELEEEEKDLQTFGMSRSKWNPSKSRDDLLMHSYLEKETEDDKEKFLRDFVMNNGWLDKGEEKPSGPGNYSVEIDLHSTEMQDEDEIENEEDEEDFDEKVDEFEAKYNFRFEEPDGIQISSHPRKVEESLRRPDDRRKRAREARKKRKEKEKLLKTEEIKHLKNLKKKEVEARLLALKDAAGTGVDFSGLDLDADFDPDKFAKEMESKFGDEYYQQDDKDFAGLKDSTAVVTEVRPDIEDLVENSTEKLNTGEIKDTVGRLMDEYYNLDYEDIIGGVPVRFKYKQVEPEDFSFTPSEILTAEDKDLNRRVSLKYLAPYRTRREVMKARYRSRKAKGYVRSSQNFNEADEQDQRAAEYIEFENNRQSKSESVSGNKYKQRRSNTGSLSFADNVDLLHESRKRKKARLDDKSHGDTGKGRTEGKISSGRKSEKRKKKKQDVINSMSENRLAAYNIPQ